MPLRRSSLRAFKTTLQPFSTKAFAAAAAGDDPAQQAHAEALKNYCLLNIEVHLNIRMHVTLSS
jgi:hypothetical protein